MAGSNTIARDVLVVIVLYKRSLSKVLTGLLGRLGEETAVFVYDNSPTAQATEGFTVIYKNNPRNEGVSKAYNEAWLVANQLNKRWMLLLDQDTKLTSNLLAAFEKAIAQHPEIRIFCPRMRDSRGIVSPYRFMMGKGWRLDHAKEGVHDLNNLMLINSGTLIHTNIFRNHGGYDERFPLDFSDVVFFSRIRSTTSQFVLVDETCEHHLSSENNTDINEAMVRFKTYCTAARNYQRITDRFVWMKIPMLARCLKLSVRYQSWQFLKIPFQAT